MYKVFSQEDLYIMMDHNVPRETAYQRYKILKWDKQRAMTEPLRKRRRKTETVPRLLRVDELNWKDRK